MATFTDIYKQELKGRGVVGSLGTAALKRTKERLDPRNMLFGGKGFVAATGQKIFGKGYSAIDKSAGKKLSDSGSFNGEIKSEALNALLVSSQKQEAQLSIIAKNTMNSNAMARDINVMRQNIMKLVTMGGGKASRGSDMFFKDAAARESAYESQFGKQRAKTVTTPTKIENKKEEKSGGILGLLAPLLTLGGTIVSAITGALSGLGTAILEGLSKILTIDNLTKALGFAKDTLSAIFHIAKLVATNPLFLTLAGITAVAGVLSFLRSDYDGRKEEYLGLAKKKKEQGLSTEEEARLRALDAPALRSEATKELGYDPIEGKESTEKTSKQVGAENARKAAAGRFAGTEYESFDAQANKARSDFGKTDPRRTDISSEESSPTPAPSSPEEITPMASMQAPTKVPTLKDNVIPGMDFKSYADKVGERESRNNYKAENTIGYLGKYQFGAAALEDLGFIKRGASKKGKNKEVLNDPKNWNLSGGKQEFLNSPDLQENAFALYTAKNYGTLIKLKVLNKDSSAEEKGGYLMAAHLLGPGGALKLKQGEIGKDAYGTTSSSYYALGSQTQTSTGKPEMSASAITPNTGTALTSGSTAASDMKLSISSQPPVISVNAPTTVNNGGSSAASQTVASALNTDAMELFLRQSYGAM
jgi:hypothetical protein